jgi:hypothetical protein
MPYGLHTQLALVVNVHAKTISLLLIRICGIIAGVIYWLVFVMIELRMETVIVLVVMWL